MDFLFCLKELREGGGACPEASPFLAYSRLCDAMHGEEEKLCLICLRVWQACPPSKAFLSCQSLTEAKEKAKEVYGFLRPLGEEPWKKAMQHFITLELGPRGIPLPRLGAKAKTGASLPPLPLEAPPPKAGREGNEASGLRRRKLRAKRKSRFFNPPDPRGLRGFLHFLRHRNAKRRLPPSPKKKREKRLRKFKIGRNGANAAGKGTP